MYRVERSTAEFCSAGTVYLNIDGRSRGTFYADHDANVDMTEIFYCLYVVFIISDYVQYMYM